MQTKQSIARQNGFGTGFGGGSTVATKAKPKPVSPGGIGTGTDEDDDLIVGGPETNTNSATTNDKIEKKNTQTLSLPQPHTTGLRPPGNKGVHTAAGVSIENS